MLCFFGSAAFAQPLANGGYPNVDKQLEVSPGDTIQLLSRMLLDGGPAMRLPGRRLEFHYTSRIPATDSAGRQAEADRAAQFFGASAVDAGVRRLSIGICDTKACAERRHPPAMWFMYERSATGWRRTRS
jgi:hypothetical protein